LTGALHTLQLQLSPPLPSSLAPTKPANPGSPGKMAVKKERAILQAKYLQTRLIFSKWYQIYMKADMQQILPFMT